MKIITNDRAYIQYADAFNLPSIISLMGITCPPSVTNKCFRKDFVVNGDNRYSFIEFHEKEAIEFFKKIDCIASYELIEKEEEELLELVKNLIKEGQDLINKYNKMDSRKQKKNFHKYQNLYHLKTYKAHSIKELILYKRGVNVYDLPIQEKRTEEEKPKEKVKKNIVNTDHHIV